MPQQAPVWEWRRAYTVGAIVVAASSASGWAAYQSYQDGQRMLSCRYAHGDTFWYAKKNSRPTIGNRSEGECMVAIDSQGYRRRFCDAGGYAVLCQFIPTPPPGAVPVQPVEEGVTQVDSK